MSYYIPQIALIRAYRKLDQAQIAACATKAGVKPRQVANMLNGRPLSADAFLRLSVAAGHDPMPDLPQPLESHEPADLDRVRLALGLRIMRGRLGQDERGAAAEMGISAATVCRAENAEVLSIRMVLIVCRYLNSHVFGWLRPDSSAVISRPASITLPDVSRETCGKIQQITIS